MTRSTANFFSWNQSLKLKCDFKTVCYLHCVEREREREREREGGEREREKERERQTDRQTDRQTVFHVLGAKRITSAVH